MAAAALFHLLRSNLARRHELYADYKGQRPESPPEIKEAIRLLVPMLQVGVGESVALWAMWGRGQIHMLAC